MAAGATDVVGASDERALLLRIERLEQALLIAIEVGRAMLKAQNPSVSWPGHVSTAAQAVRKLDEAADLLKHEGDPS